MRQFGSVLKVKIVLLILFLLSFITPLIYVWLIEDRIVIPMQVHKDFEQTVNKVVLDRTETRNEAQFDTCPVFKLDPNINAPDKEAVKCRRADFIPGSCNLMKKLFTDRPANCSQKHPDIICAIKKYNPSNPRVTCHNDLCTGPLFLGLYREDTGDYQWESFNSADLLAAFINSKLLVDYMVYHHGYCLLKCRNQKGRLVKQLLILPPVLRSTEEAKSTATPKQVRLNVNILLLDSVSRHHFFRILQKTVSTFRTLNEDVFKTGRVFDFELVQGIKGRTFESLQALFAGKAFDSAVLRLKTVDLNETLGKFKAFGYETLYVEDMCWEWEWGLVKEQRALNFSAPHSTRMKLFVEATKRAGIDRTDVSYSSCEILQQNGFKDMFHGPDAICYNGIHQHTYLLQYMEYFLARFSYLQKPAFSFLILDTAHEDTGIRLKQLDEDLARHVTFLANQQNTVTFILSDHGNNYGRFVAASRESQVELFHTHLFVIVPDQAAILLGKDKMRSLLTNQHRLVSLIDVHHTVKSLLPSASHLTDTKDLIYNVNMDGLLSPVSANRTCQDIPRIQPNLCICQNHYTPQLNDSYHALFAEFALAHMNRQIFHEQQNSIQACQRLVATRFGDVKVEEVSENEVMVNLDLYVRAPKSTGRTEERFTVSIHFSNQENIETMLFLGFDRITSYSIYRKCSNTAVDLRLCICDLQAADSNEYLNQSVLWQDTITSVIHEPCLYLQTRKYPSGVVLAISNVCFDVQYNVVFDFLTLNLHSSTLMPLILHVEPQSEEHLVIGIQKNKHKPWKYKYRLNYNTFTV
ncbi:hypothetical protein AOXY_G1898 [Acipenser oxyrinchus oxyrinchus]|uniref:Uncharacterized protein n=1 Tax=Acipenser oxyrinchus oxyrinchus TaxID=40147 RepID=A0AAD8GH79_ACIOX|nr:hypothetical protein AOXY_G1898 [Acipenser oxyrinchus oxyrinchus]